MTLYLFVASIILLSMGKSVIQTSAEAAGPQGMSLIFKPLEIRAKF
jgi:hypothetical protein